MDNQQLSGRDPLPDEFASLTAAGEFWDTHSTADYEEDMSDVSFEVNLTGKPTYYFAIAKDIAAALQNVAQQQGISTQTLINLWLQEKLIHMTN
jgi:predicted HicB family RNase H-like nuclease